MNLAIVFNLVGIVLLISSFFMLIPIGTSFLYDGPDLKALIVSFFVTLCTGALLFLLTRDQERKELKHREGFAVVTFSWLAISLCSAFTYMVSGTMDNITDAFFESMAGFTTTGSSVLSNLESIPHGILMWRSLTQWMGGMGIIVFSLAILPMLGAGGMQLFKAEVPEIGVEKLKPRIIDMSKSLWYIYAGLTAALAILLMLCGMDLFDAVCHSFTTMATGGFSTRSASIGAFESPYIDAVITVFMFLAGVNFSLHFYALRGKMIKVLKSSELRFYGAVVLISIAFVTVYLVRDYGMGLPAALRYSSFQVVSIVTTTGYATADYELWPIFTQLLLLSLMLFGGMVGSTGGGMKQVRILLMLKQAYRELYHLIHPHAMSVLKLDDRNVPKETLGGIWGFLFLYMSIGVVASLLLAGMGVDIITASSTVVSSLSNVGPALGAAGPAENYAVIPQAGKWVLIFCMLAGRLEIYTVILIFIPMFWRK